MQQIEILKSMNIPCNIDNIPIWLKNLFPGEYSPKEIVRFSGLSTSESITELNIYLVLYRTQKEHEQHPYFWPGFEPHKEILSLAEKISLVIQKFEKESKLKLIKGDLFTFNLYLWHDGNTIILSDDHKNLDLSDPYVYSIPCGAKNNIAKNYKIARFKFILKHLYKFTENKLKLTFE